MTLIPVSRISWVGVRSEAFGAGRWIGQRSSTCTSGPLSIASPSRLKMRPRVASPTGTVIGPPVSTTRSPRWTPSVASIATARTRSSPRCCCTSQTSCVASPSPSPAVSIVTAEKISGSWSGKAASITTPVTCSTRPTLLPFAPLLSAMASFSRLQIEGSLHLSSLSERLGAADDLQDLLRDFRLTRPIHLQGQVADHRLRVLGGVAHRGHPRAQLRGRRLQQRPVDRDRHVLGNQPSKQLLGIGLVEPLRAALGFLRLRFLLFGGSLLLGSLAHHLRLLQRQQRLPPHVLRQRRDEAVVDQLDPVEVLVDVAGGHLLADLAGVGKRRAVGEADVGGGDVLLAEGQCRDALAADDGERGLGAFLADLRP